MDAALEADLGLVDELMAMPTFPGNRVSRLSLHGQCVLAARLLLRQSASITDPKDLPPVVRFADAALNPDEGLARWRTTWTPGTHPKRSGECSLADGYAVFVNAHRTAAATGIQDVALRASNFVDHSFVERGEKTAVRIREAISVIVMEALENVREHANMLPGSSASVVVVQVAARNMWIVVLDNGEGIVETARPKMRDPAAEPRLILRQLITSKYEPTWRARGFGLPRMHDITNAAGGHFTILSRNACFVRGETADLPGGLPGTAVVATFPTV
jgi:anti-sigma regulatory factor (Ser/Thr protein kinase)